MAQFSGNTVTIEKDGKAYKIRLLDIKAVREKTTESGAVMFDVELTVSLSSPELWDFGMSLIEEEE